MTSLSSDFQSRIIIPNSISMISLLGTNDENLKIVEKSFPEVSLHVRGNEININGNVNSVKLVNQLFAELISLIRIKKGVINDTLFFEFKDVKDLPSC